MTQDLSTITDRLSADLLNGSGDSDEAHISSLLGDLKPDGHWPDVDYADTSRTHWAPILHLQRLLDLAKASRTPGGRFQGTTKARDGFLSGLRFWTERDPQSDNWWYNVIGAPRTLGGALLLMREDLPADLIEAADPQMRRSGFTRTGANLVWEASNLLTWSCVTGDAGLLEEAVDRIGNEIRITTDEGIQHDDSFYQHGPQNYALGYGRSFAVDVTRIAVVLAGTGFAFPEEKVRILSRLILDGQQWFIHGRQIDYHAMGREAFRGGPGNHSWNAGSLAGVCANMRSADPSRAAELDAFASRVTGDEPPGVSGPLGNKHFWRSDTMVHRGGNWYASVRFHSTRTYAVEARVNRENLLGYHLSDGVLFLMQRGDEYHELQPVWDYRKLPGLTFLETDAPLPYGSEAPREGDTLFVGGVSDGLTGAAVMDYEKGGVRARKAYFFAEDGIACLGAGIASEQPERVLTTLNQCRLVTDVCVLRGGKADTVESGRLEAEDVQAFLQDGIGYVLLEPASLTIQAGPQSGSWRRVEDRATDDSLTEAVFTCFIDHGVKPSDAGYAYHMVPGATAKSLGSRVEDPSVHILANTTALQAISRSRDGLTQAIFHESGDLYVPDFGGLGVDAPCAVQVRGDGDARTLAVADPTQALRQVTVTLAGRWTGRGASFAPGENATRVVLPLPEGPFAGQSVVVPLRRR